MVYSVITATVYLYNLSEDSVSCYLFLLVILESYLTEMEGVKYPIVECMASNLPAPLQRACIFQATK